jgi:hypothetical protein
VATVAAAAGISGTLQADTIVPPADYDALVNTPTASDVAAVKDRLTHDYNGGDWVLGLPDSLAHGNPDVYSVGYADGSSASAQDAGVNVNPGQTLILPVLAGDVNMDGTVDFFDLSQLLGYKYNTGQPASYTDGDLNYDGVVDFFDLAILLSGNYNTGVTLHRDAPSAPVSETPLPSAALAGTALMGTVGVVRAVRRKKAT